MIDGEPGTATIPALTPWPGEINIRKPGKGAFHATELDVNLRAKGIRHLVFAGVATDTSVQTSLREAGDRGYYSLLAEDATASAFPSFRRATIDMVNAQSGIAGWVAPSSAIITALGRQG